jgi:hypothetical protein
MAARHTGRTLAYSRQLRNNELMRSAPPPSLIISILALFVALGGTSYAAVKLNGKNIKAGTVTGKQIKNNSISGTDIKQGSVKRGDLATDIGTLGAKGDKGDKGDPGENGAGVLDDTIPSGKTVIGNWALTASNGTPAAHFYYENIAFPVPAAVGPDSGSVNFSSNPLGIATDDADSSCTGSSIAPTAPPGKVCLYTSSSGKSLSPEPTSLLANSGTIASRGFTLRVALPVDARYNGNGSWAYTAP